MVAILGLSALYHDSAAALMIDGEIVAAAQEERFSRIKHDSSFPVHAIEFCLNHAGISQSELDWVCYYEKPLLRFDRILETYLDVAPRGFVSFARAMPGWLREKLWVRRQLTRVASRTTGNAVVFCRHHESHAASAFFPSPFETAAILTVDGVGEWETATWGVGQGNRIELQRRLRFPHSLGLLYSAFTAYCGFRVNSGEYKLMGLAPYGKPVYADRIRQHLVNVRADGSFRLDLSYFRFIHGLQMTSRKFHRLFDGPPRKPESELTKRFMNVAASIQAVLEDILLRMVHGIHEETGLKSLCLAGGVALNAVANGRILREGPFEHVWIQPAAGDAGGALGAAFWVWHQRLNKPRCESNEDRQAGSLFGPEFSSSEVRDALDRSQLCYEEFASHQDLCDRVAALLEEQRVVGWFQGRMEFGPRSLGNRSLLAAANRKEMQTTLNQCVKRREDFRPFAPVTLHEFTQENFEIPPGAEFPYMLVVVPVRGERFPTITHVDGSARLQTVRDSQNPQLGQLLRTFHSRTGQSVLVNTSFNVRGEPIVCTPDDAIRCFQMTGIDALAIDRFLVTKPSHSED
ncbi:carbamoyltransferase family protein [Thalassoroseus pseudoceratinae]|uniref:carbamoyltransferase family protein n=1 Tax=Thalassoroseus pseudoceratinae TaxID=2713176 RepID=UPI00141FB46C|nr:carbamoyltransferase N-terminal domain-containing protein [Thalassoroseus pseudoceratinae]